MKRRTLLGSMALATVPGLGVWAAEGLRNDLSKIDSSESRKRDFLDVAKGSRTPESATCGGVGVLPPRLLGSKLIGGSIEAKMFASKYLITKSAVQLCCCNRCKFFLNSFGQWDYPRSSLKKQGPPHT